MTVREKRGRADGALVLACLLLAAAVAALWLYFAGLQAGRKPATDAVFVRRVEGFLQKG